MKTADKIIDKKIEELKAKPASKIILGIYDYQDQHIKWFLNNKGGFIRYFEPSYDFYVSLISSINFVEKKDWKWPRKLSYIYLGNSTYPLFKAYTVGLEGFYDEALVLCREAFELIIKSIFCIYYPDDCFATYSKPEKGKRTFNITNFIEKDLKLDWGFVYRLASAGAHGKLYVTRILHKSKADKKAGPIGLQLKLDEQMASAVINYLTFLIWANIYLVITIFSKLAPTEIANKKVSEDAKFYIETLGHIVKSTPKGFGKVGNDFEKVINIVELSIIKDKNKL